MPSCPFTKWLLSHVIGHIGRRLLDPARHAIDQAHQGLEVGEFGLAALRALACLLFRCASRGAVARAMVTAATNAATLRILIPCVLSVEPAGARPRLWRRGPAGAPMPANSLDHRRDIQASQLRNHAKYQPNLGF